MLETSSLVRKYKHIYSCIYILHICIFLLLPRLYQEFCWWQHFFVKYQNFSSKIVLFYSKHKNENCVRDSLALFSVFVRQKVTVNEKVSFADYTSRLRLTNCSKLVRYNVIVKFFDVAVFGFSSLDTGSSFTSISLLVLELWKLCSRKDWTEIQ